MGTLKNEATNNQKQMILRLLERGKKITAIEALQPPFNCMRLASRVSDLKKEGHPITKEMITLKESGKRVAQYSLLKTA